MLTTPPTIHTSSSFIQDMSWDTLAQHFYPFTQHPELYIPSTTPSNPFNPFTPSLCSLGTLQSFIKYTEGEHNFLYTNGYTAASLSAWSHHFRYNGSQAYGLDWMGCLHPTISLCSDYFKDIWENAYDTQIIVLEMILRN